VEGALAKSRGAAAKPPSLPEALPLVVESSSCRGVALGPPLCAAGRIAGAPADWLCEGRVGMSLASTVLGPAAGAAGCDDPVAGAAGACGATS
jgi:hypothetical protein